MSLSAIINLPSLPPIPAARLTVDQAEALRYLRHPGAPPPELAERLRQAGEAVLAAADPRFCLRGFAIAPRRPGEPLELAGASLKLPGKDIAALLAGSEICLVMAATLGSGTDQLIRRAQITDVSYALLLDACASCAIESLMENIMENLTERLRENIIKNNTDNQPLHLTRRFSPGYGDLPLALQRPLCAVLDTPRRIGLTVSQSGLLLPRKSVTALAGLSPQPQAAAAPGCAGCAQAASCPYRRQNPKQCARQS